MTKGLSTILIAFVILITLPLWIGLIAGGFGLIVGIFAAMFGVIAGIFGLFFGIIGGLLDFLLGGVFDWSWHGPNFSIPHFHFNRYVLAAIVIVFAMIISKRQRSKRNQG